jgi:hypothetical protein
MTSHGHPRRGIPAREHRGRLVADSDQFIDGTSGLTATLRDAWRPPAAAPASCPAETSVACTRRRNHTRARSSGGDSSDSRRVRGKTASGAACRHPGTAPRALITRLVARRQQGQLPRARRQLNYRQRHSNSSGASPARSACSSAAKESSENKCSMPPGNGGRRLPGD